MAADCLQPISKIPMIYACVSSNDLKGTICSTSMLKLKVPFHICFHVFDKQILSAMDGVLEA